jgi:hypothetical protein
MHARKRSNLEGHSVAVLAVGIMLGATVRPCLSQTTSAGAGDAGWNEDAIDGCGRPEDELGELSNRLVATIRRTTCALPSRKVSIIAPGGPAYELRAAIYAELCAPVCAAVCAAIRPSVRAAIRPSVRAAIRPGLHAPVRPDGPAIRADQLRPPTGCSAGQFLHAKPAIERAAGLWPADGPHGPDCGPALSTAGLCPPPARSARDRRVGLGPDDEIILEGSGPRARFAELRACPAR